jgi:hypothetical protein
MALRIVAALGSLAFIALASRAQFDHTRALPRDELVLVAVGLIGFAALVLGVSALVIGGGYAVFGESRQKPIVLVAAAILVAIVVALAFAPLNATVDPLPTPTGTEEPPTGSRRALPAGTFSAVALIVAAAVAFVAATVAAVAVYGIIRRRRRVLVFGEQALVVEAIDESLDDLRREPDVRRAIIACYARMERALERAGSARRPAEAPLEYLIRLHERVGAHRTGARTLTELFERAKFSAEPMAEREKFRAIETLEALRAVMKAS